ncbi:MAG: hypothetical protein IKE17_16115 [Clostridia bacterium]|nr:hypothetical protein [Clostridia bacterium]MBR2799246.1 hypothetical protein [Clostridia bacterium]
MIRREDFIDALGMPDEGFTSAVDAALRQVKEGEARPVMKRKMTLTILAAVLAVIALTGAALAVGLNLFDHFGRNDRRLQVVAPDAALVVNDAVEVTTDALGVSKARIDSAYYDGQSLIVAYTLDNYQRCEPFTPTETELAQMTENKDFLLEAYGIVEGDPDANEAFRAAIDRKQPYGVVEYMIGLGDRCTTDGGVTLPLHAAAMEDGEEGLLYCIQEFETPLPESVRDLDSLNLTLPVELSTSWYWFDGETCYEKHDEQPLATLTAAVSRSEAETRSYKWEGEINGAKVSARAEASAVHIKLYIDAEAGAFPDPATIWPEAAEADDTWYSFVLTDSRDMEYRFSGGIEGEGTLEAEYDGLGYLPNDLTLTVRLEGEGDWDGKDHTLPGFPVTLRAE